MGSEYGFTLTYEDEKKALEAEKGKPLSKEEDRRLRIKYGKPLDYTTGGGA